MTSPWSVPIFQTLTVPTDAGVGHARLFIGDAMPPPLTTFTFAGGTLKYAAAIVGFAEGGTNSNFVYLGVIEDPANDQFGWHLGTVLNGAVVLDNNGYPATIELLGSRTLNSQAINIMARETALLRADDVVLVDVSKAGGSLMLHAENTGGTVEVNGESDVTIRTVGAGASTIHLDTSAGTGDILLVSGDNILFDGLISVGPTGSPQAGYIPYRPVTDAANAPATVTGTTSAAPTTIPGIATTINVIANDDQWFFRAYFGISTLVAGAGQLFLCLIVDNVVTGVQPDYLNTANAQIDMYSYEWILSGAALGIGAHTIKLGAYDAAINQYQLRATSLLITDARYRR